MNNLIGWVRASTRNTIVAVVVVLAVVVCCCGGSLAAVLNQGSTTTPQQANVSVTNTPSGPTATPRPPTATPRPTATPKPKQWVTVQHWSGSSNSQTPTFHLPDGSRIVWSYQATDQASLISVELDDATDNTPIDLIVNDANMDHSSGTYNVHGDYQAYLKIQADSVNYDVQVQVYQ